MPLLHHATPKNCVEIAISMPIMAMRDVPMCASLQWRAAAAAADAAVSAQPVLSVRLSVCHCHAAAALPATGLLVTSAPQPRAGDSRPPVTSRAPAAAATSHNAPQTRCPLPTRPRHDTRTQLHFHHKNVMSKIEQKNKT